MVLNTDAFEEEIRVLLPPGFKVDEFPDAVAVKSEYGAFQAKWDVQMRSPRFTRKLEVPARAVPATDYNSVKKLFDSVLGSNGQPVVLIR